MAGAAASNGDDINFQLFHEVKKKMSSSECIRELLAAGANPFFVPYHSQIEEENGEEVKNFSDDCAVFAAVRANKVELVKLLLHFDGKRFRERSFLEKFQLYAMLCETCEFNILHGEMIHVLLEYGVWVNDPDFNFCADELKEIARRTLYYGNCSPYSSCMNVHARNFFGEEQDGTVDYLEFCFVLRSLIQFGMRFKITDFVSINYYLCEDSDLRICDLTTPTPENYFKTFPYRPLKGGKTFGFMRLVDEKTRIISFPAVSWTPDVHVLEIGHPHPVPELEQIREVLMCLRRSQPGLNWRLRHLLFEFIWGSMFNVFF